MTGARNKLFSRFFGLSRDYLKAFGLYAHYNSTDTMSAMPNKSNKSAETFLRKALKIVDPNKSKSSYVVHDVE